MKIKDILIIVMFYLSACSEPVPMKSVPLTVEILDDEGAPIVGASVHVDKKDLGLSASSGRVSTKIFGDEGRPVHVEIDCPAGFKSLLEHERTMSLRFLSRLDEQKSIAPMEMRFICVPKIRDHVLVIRTDNRADIPIKIMDKEVTRTDEEGVALWHIKGAPGEEVLVTLDTSKHQELRPASPHRRLLLPTKSRFLVFDQKFEEKKKVARKKKRKKRNKGPIRL